MVKHVGPTEETTDLALKVGHRIGSLIIKSIMSGDIKTIKKVFEIIPGEGKLLSEIALELEREKTRKHYEEKLNESDHQ